MHIRHCLALLVALSATAEAACPKNKKEWQARGPKIFLEKAAHQPAPVTIDDFSAKLGKKGATATALPFKDRKGEFVLVQARDEETSLFLSGILKCDAQKQEPVLLSLTYVKGDKSGLVKVLKQ